MFRPHSVGVLPWLLAVLLPAQEPAAPPARQGAEQIAKAVGAWLSSDQVDERQLQATVAAVLFEPGAGLSWLGERLRAARAAPGDRDRNGLTALATQVVLEFVRRTRKSGMTFSGQYAPLRALQPFAGDLLLRLLLQTPDWYSDTDRQMLVPPLRDLFAAAPSPAVLLGVIAVVENTEIEPDDLRLDLACLLWQWGRKEFVQPRLEQLRAASAEGDAEDRVFALRELALLQYRIHDYAHAAAAHAALCVLADRARIPLSPTDWYWAACCHALAGDRERGLQALKRCFALQAADDVDDSAKLPRTLFERDPEIALLRADPSFAGLLAAAFPRAPRDAKDR